MSDADDLLKNAGKFFTRLGGAAKNAGTTIKQTTKQVTGLGRGTVKVELDATKAPPGGTLRGRLVLALSESVDAKKLVVVLRARQKVMNITRTSSGRSVSTSHADVYEHETELGPAKHYESGTFAFDLTVPPDALELRPSSGTSPIADAVRTVASALSPSAGPIEWEVIGKLVIPWGRDLTSSVDVVVAG